MTSNRRRRAKSPLSATQIVHEPAIQFDQRRMDLIFKALPPDVDPRRRKLLPQILQDWADNELKRAKGIRPDKVFARERLKSFRRVIRHARALRESLADFDVSDNAAYWLAYGSDHVGFPDQDLVNRIKRQLEGQVELLTYIDAVAQKVELVFKKACDQRRNITSYLVMLFLAAIFEWLTGLKPTRGSSDRPSPFNSFLEALWPVIFENADVGLEAAVKN
jgi:hypothetical protein